MFVELSSLKLHLVDVESMHVALVDTTASADTMTLLDTVASMHTMAVAWWTPWSWWTQRPQRILWRRQTTPSFRLAERQVSKHKPICNIPFHTFETGLTQKWPRSSFPSIISIFFYLFLIFSSETFFFKLFIS